MPHAEQKANGQFLCDERNVQQKLACNCNNVEVGVAAQPYPLLRHKKHCVCRLAHCTGCLGVHLAGPRLGSLAELRLSWNR